MVVVCNEGLTQLFRQSLASSITSMIPLLSIPYLKDSGRNKVLLWGARPESGVNRDASKKEGILYMYYVYHGIIITMLYGCLCYGQCIAVLD